MFNILDFDKNIWSYEELEKTAAMFLPKSNYFCFFSCENILKIIKLAPGRGNIARNQMLIYFFFFVYGPPSAPVEWLGLKMGPWPSVPKY
jgi:hypothetical protein